MKGNNDHKAVRRKYSVLAEGYLLLGGIHLIHLPASLHLQNGMLGQVKAFEGSNQYLIFNPVLPYWVLNGDLRWSAKPLVG